jgi:hypothetical protein
MRKRLQTYMTGKDKHYDVEFILNTTDSFDVEKCAKVMAKKYQYSGKSELYKTDVDLLKEIIFECVNIKKHMNNYGNKKKELIKKYDAHIIFDSGKSNRLFGFEWEKIYNFKIR